MATNGTGHRSGQFSDPEVGNPENSSRRLTNRVQASKANAAKEESRSESAADGKVPSTSSGQKQPNGNINGHQQIDQPPLKMWTGCRGRGRTAYVKDQPQVIGLPLMGKLRSPSPQQMNGRASQSLNGQPDICTQTSELVNGHMRIDPCQPQQMSGYQQTNGHSKVGSNTQQQINGGPQIHPEPPEQINGQSEIQTRMIGVPAPSKLKVTFPDPRTSVYVPPQRRNGGSRMDYQNPPDTEMPPRGPDYRRYRENCQPRTPESTPADEDDNWRQRK